MNTYHWTFCVDAEGKKSKFSLLAFASLDLQYTLSGCGSNHVRATRLWNIRCLHLGDPDGGGCHSLSTDFLDGMTEASQAIRSMAGLEELELDCLRYLLDFEVLETILGWWDDASALHLRKLSLVVSDDDGQIVSRAMSSELL